MKIKDKLIKLAYDIINVVLTLIALPFKIIGCVSCILGELIDILKNRINGW